MSYTEGIEVGDRCYGAKKSHDERQAGSGLRNGFEPWSWYIVGMKKPSRQAELMSSD